jgi:superfamily II DNA or RNA helicase
LWGEKSTAKRDAAVRRLVTGDIDVLIVSVIFQEGTDIPDIRSVIVGSAGKSAIAAIQRVGRGMRVVEGKKEFHVYDVYDKGHRTLKKWAKERKAAYELEGYEVVDP